MPSDGALTALVTEAIHNHFADKADMMRRDLSDLFWQGRISLLIGLAFLALCLLAADTIGQSRTTLVRNGELGCRVWCTRILLAFHAEWRKDGCPGVARTARNPC